MEKKSAGFTLVEILITIAIIGIVAAIAIPNFLTVLPKWRAKSAATDLFSNLQLAKMTAIRQGRDCSVTFSTGPDQYQISLLNKTVSLATYGSGLQFRGPAPQFTTFETSPLTFNSRGMLTSSQGYTYFTNADQNVYYRAGATSAGVVVLQKLEGGQWN